MSLFKQNLLSLGCSQVKWQSAEWKWQSSGRSAQASRQPSAVPASSAGASEGLTSPSPVRITPLGPWTRPSLHYCSTPKDERSRWNVCACCMSVVVTADICVASHRAPLTLISLVWVITSPVRDDFLASSLQLLPLTHNYCYVCCYK